MTAILFCLLAADPGSTALLRGDWQGAVDAFTVLIDEKPTATAHINRGIAYGHLGKAREALTDFNAAQKLEPTNPAVYANRANLLAKAGYHEHALADYGRSLKLKDDKSVRAMRGWAHHKAGDYAEAKADYLKAIPDHRALNNLAWMQATCPDAEFRDGKAAVEHATKVCELTGWRVKAYVSTLAAAHAESGDFAKAAELAERIGDEHLEMYKAGKPVRE